MDEIGRVGPGGYVHGWIRVGGVKTPADPYPPDVKLMKTEDIGKLTSDLEPHLTVEQRYQRKPRDETQAQLDKAIAKQGWHPSPVEVLNGERLTDGHHTYAAARERGVSHLPVRHYQRVKRMADTWTQQRFNMVHAPAGSATGGQFAASGGSAAAAPAKTAPAKAAAAGTAPLSAAKAAEKARLLAQAHKDAAQADALQKQLTGLEKQAAAHATAAKKAAASATAAAKAGRIVHHRKHAAHHAAHHKHHMTLKKRITALKGQISTLRVQAASLEKQANAIRSDSTGNAGQLHEYWVRGEGAAKIRWGSPGDYNRCLLHLGKYVDDPHGYCAQAHHDALGIWPATHAAMEKHAGRAVMSTPADGCDGDGLDASWDGDHSDLPDLTGLDVPHFEAAEKTLGMTPPGQAQRAAPKLGTGARFAKLKSSLAAKGAKDPGALAAYIGRKKFGKAKFHKLASAARGKGAKRMDTDTLHQPASTGRMELFRSYPLEDYHIVRTGEGDSSGRVVEAYMTVFDEPVEIYDHQGHYKEDIDRSAFNKRIADLERSKNGFRAAKVFYNHGMTIHGTPSDRYSMPTAVCEGIRVDTRGPITRSRYLDTPLGNEVLEMWRSGAVTAQSFTGAIIRSSPELGRGEKYRPRNGELPRVKRLELGLKEYGPTPFPAYQGAELVGVRMSPLGTWQAAGGDEYEEFDDAALPPDEEAAAGEPLTRAEDGDGGEHSARYHQHALYAMRSREAREKVGLAW